MGRAELDRSELADRGNNRQERAEIMVKKRWRIVAIKSLCCSLLQGSVHYISKQGSQYL